MEGGGGGTLIEIIWNPYPYIFLIVTLITLYNHHAQLLVSEIHINLFHYAENYLQIDVQIYCVHIMIFVLNTIANL